VTKFYRWFCNCEGITFAGGAVIGAVVTVSLVCVLAAAGLLRW